MKDAYTNAFYNVVKETQETSGVELPSHIETYVVMLLARNLDRPDFLPEKSFIEAYLKLKKPANYNAKELGDACLFVCGVFPTYGSKHGLKRTYYSNIGVSSYEMVAETLNGQLFSQLAKHFDFISEFIEMATTPSNTQIKPLYIRR